jgi:hypothetical protein
MRVEYHPHTASELNSAVDHYNGLRPGLGDALRLEVYAAISRICFNPQQYREIEGGMRLASCIAFPTPFCSAVQLRTSSGYWLFVIIVAIQTSA